MANDSPRSSSAIGPATMPRRSSASIPSSSSTPRALNALRGNCLPATDARRITDRAGAGRSSSCAPYTLWTVDGSSTSSTERDSSQPAGDCSRRPLPTHDLRSSSTNSGLPPDRSESRTMSSSGRASPTSARTSSAVDSGESGSSSRTSPLEIHSGSASRSDGRDVQTTRRPFPSVAALRNAR